ATHERRLPPEPRLQPEPPEWRTPREDLRDFRRQEDETLNTYGWADKNAGAVRIPISEAMKLTVQRGLPARPAGGERGKGGRARSLSSFSRLGRPPRPRRGRR